MKEPIIATDYHDRDVRAVFQVIIELGQILVPFRNNVVLVGGSVPWLLLNHARPAHLGTLDVDLGLNPKGLSEGQYAELVETLEKQGYRRGDDLKPFQLLRLINVDDGGEPVPVIVDLLMPREAKYVKNRPPLVEGLRVQAVDGCSIAIRDNITKHLEGYMPDGRMNSVEVRIATIPATLVMKGYALSGRDKMKDAYDIYFSVRNFDGGIAALAERCIPLLADEIALEGFRKIAVKFRSRDDFGPTTVRRFLEDAPEFTELTPEQVQTDAFGQVNNLLQKLRLD
tara:strand:+ start:10848 stop:11699 length:852 start_codon:yes stop_codon:yes gene_type:complete